MLTRAQKILIILLLAASSIAAQEESSSDKPMSLAEIDRQLNNPLAKTWALVLQDNIGINDGELVDGTTTSKPQNPTLTSIPSGNLPLYADYLYI